MKKLNNKQKIDLILEDLEGYLSRGEDLSSLRYAYENGYYLHAASLWVSSGGMSEELEKKVLPVKINHKKEMKEINAICENAVIFICPDCNHHHFVGESELRYIGLISENEIRCESCGGTAIKDTDNE